MTREEQLDWLCRLRSEIYVYMPKEWLIPMDDALDMSIKALEQETVSKEVYDHEYFLRKEFELKIARLEQTFDKIRVEILEEKECAYADFEQYKLEYLGQDWEDVLDSLPQDDFRYGMERAIELIDKYKAESEGVKNDTRRTRNEETCSGIRCY